MTPLFLHPPHLLWPEILLAPSVTYVQKLTVCCVPPPLDSCRSLAPLLSPSPPFILVSTQHLRQIRSPGLEPSVSPQFSQSYGLTASSKAPCDLSSPPLLRPLTSRWCVDHTSPMLSEAHLAILYFPSLLPCSAFIVFQYHLPDIEHPRLFVVSPAIASLHKGENLGLSGHRCVPSTNNRAWQNGTQYVFA